MRDGFVFYGSFYDALSDLPEDLRLQAYEAICKYALLGVEPDCSGVIRTVFKLVRPQIDANNKRRENGKKGAEVSNERHDDSTEAAPDQQEVGNQSATERQEVGTDAAKEKVKEKEKVKVKEKEKRERFAPPTADEVAAYCRERNNGVDPDRFIDFYASKGWKVGNQPMKDWKACVRTWEKRDGAPQKVPLKKNAFTRFDQREYQNDELEAMLLGVGGGSG